MPKKPSVTTITSGYASNTQLNANFTALRNAFDNTLSLDGSTPNAMGADLDLNNNDILNVNALEVVSLRSNGQDLDLSGVATLAPISAEIVTLAQLQDGTVLLYGLSDLASITSDITAVSALSSDVTTVSNYIFEINTIADDLAAGSFVVGSEYDFGSITDPTSGTSGSPDGFILTVFNNLPNINTVANISSDVTTVSGISSDVVNVVSLSSEITTVSGISTDVTAVSALSTEIATVVSISGSITSLDSISSDITVAAANVTDITNFADVYYGPSATDPTARKDSSPLQEGDLYFNTVSDLINVWNGSQWLATVASLSGALAAANNLSDLIDTATARSNLGLGTIATQDSNNVNITGGVIDGGSIV
jgi:hypothetical protein